MTESEQIAEWLHCFKILQTDEARLQLCVHLKQEKDKGNKAAREALRRIVEGWLT